VRRRRRAWRHGSCILSRQSIAIQEDVSARIVEGTSLDDVDPLEILRLRNTIERYRGDAVLLELSDLDFAKALGLVDANGNTRCLTPTGLLLAGKEQSIQRRLPTHEAAFQVLSDVDVEVNQFYRSPLSGRP